MNGVQRAEPQLQVSINAHEETCLSAQGAVHLLPGGCQRYDVDRKLEDNIEVTRFAQGNEAFADFEHGVAARVDAERDRRPALGEEGVVVDLRWALVRVGFQSNEERVVRLRDVSKMFPKRAAGDQRTLVLQLRVVREVVVQHVEARVDERNRQIDQGARVTGWWALLVILIGRLGRGMP